MALNTAALNAEASALASTYPYLSLHSADPGSTGTNETSAARVAALVAAGGGRVVDDGPATCRVWVKP
jgi:hypothetical protein